MDEHIILKKMLEKIEENFAGADFLDVILKSHDFKSKNLYEKIAEISRTSYISGVEAGMSAAINFYENCEG